MSYAASGVDDVVFVARDQMNVKVRHRLARRFSNVDPDVEAVGLVFARDGLAGDREGTDYAKLGLLVARRVEPCRDVSLGDDARKFLLLNLIETYFKLSRDHRKRFRRLVSEEEFREVQEMEVMWADRMRAEGAKEGREKGSIEGQREALLRLLAKK